MTAPTLPATDDCSGKRRAVIATAVTVVVAALIVACAAGLPLRAALIGCSAVLGTSSGIPVIRDTLRGRARPALVMWATWCALTALAGIASATNGDWPSAVFALAGTATTGTVVAVALRGSRVALTVLDRVCAALIVPGLAGWLLLDVPAIAVVTACLIDAVGVVSAIPHLWRHPDQQPTATFALIAAGGLCAAGAAWGTWTVTALAYPIYVAVSTAAMAGLTLRRPPAGSAPSPISA